MKKEYCSHCSPTKRKRHFPFYAQYYLEKAAFPVVELLRGLPRGRGELISNTLWGLLMEALALARIVRFEDEPDETRFTNRELIFLKEAKKRNLDIKAVKLLGKYTNDFRFYFSKKRRYYESIPLAARKTRFEIDDKYKAKQLLEKNNIPTAQGRLFLSKEKAVKFAEQIGYPVVVKPNSGSLSVHITCAINSKEKLIEAIKIAKVFRPDFIVEKHIPGTLFRASVIASKHVFVCERDRANVTGDGTSTIEELIKIKNRGKGRGEAEQKNTTLHKIPINTILIEALSNQGLNIKAVLPKDKKIYLQEKHTLSCGCDVIGCTQETHQDNRKLFLKVANLLRADLIGVDFICPDIRKSYKEQETAVLETNSLPYLDMHQFPSHGKGDAVAKMVWDIVLDGLKR